MLQSGHAWAPARANVGARRIPKRGAREARRETVAIDRRDAHRTNNHQAGGGSLEQASPCTEKSPRAYRRLDAMVRSERHAKRRGQRCAGLRAVQITVEKIAAEGQNRPVIK